MASHFQAAPLVASPSYPDSIAWSEENLVAIASGNLITILNPSLLVGPRGVITLQPDKPFPTGMVIGGDLPFIPPRTRPCARSLSWSPLGFAPNSGCLLAVCTTEGRVKLYRAPFCEFCAEWVEVMDISDMLYDYLEINNFGELNTPSTKIPEVQISAGCNNESARNTVFQDSLSSKVPKYRKKEPSPKYKKGKEIERSEDAEHTKPLGEDLRNDANGETFRQATYFDRNGDLESSKSNDKVSDDVSENFMIKNVDGGSCSRFGGWPLAKRQEDDVLPLITGKQYTSHSALLSSLIVAWSPVFQLSPNCPLDSFPNNYAILAVGGKAGNISFWRFPEPECYTLEHGVSVDGVLIGLLQAHNSWITAISWGICAGSFSEFQLVLASGSSDGSVKLWLADVKGLINSSVNGGASFSLFKEVTAVTYDPISTISLIVSVQSLDKVIFAIGKGSGSVEVWICHISSNTLENAGAYNVHGNQVTGLAWAFGGRCLYGCSEGNYLHSWMLDGNYLYEVPFSPKFPGLKNSSNLSQASDHCYGLALSSGDLIIAVVRSFDASLLNQMYQARKQKAVVEFFWIGGQPLAMSSGKHLDCSTEVLPGLTKRDLVCWESNIIWSLKCYSALNKLLLLWDVITALLAFKKYGSTLVESVLSKWISSWFPDIQSDAPIEKVLSHTQNMLPKISNRKMHLLNIICRRLMLGEMKDIVTNEEQHRLSGSNDDKSVKVDNIWNKLLMNSERELQERLVAFTFRTVLCVPCSLKVSAFCTSWSPIGVSQMKRWVLINSEHIQQQLKLLGLKVGELGSRVNLHWEDEAVETCKFCSASVPFESPGVAWCEGIKHKDGSRERHKLSRCSISMQLCSVNKPSWFCMCCQRWAAMLAPQTFFTLPKSPLDTDYDNGTFALPEHKRSRPLCPFCGILLQRLLPDFLLSASPV